LNTSHSYYGESIIGGRSENQDSFGYLETKFGLLALVCDGMGGGKGGKKASSLATSVVLDDISNSKSSDPVNAIYNAIQKANFEVFRTQINDTALTGMGTTICLVIITDDDAIIAHVGDSRVYQYAQDQVINKTWDHSFVFDMLKDGLLNNEEEARTHPRSNEITRALGLRPAIDIELQRWDYNAGDIFYLCSDGINGIMDNETLQELVSKAETAKHIVNSTVSKAHTLGVSAGGGHDNATAIAIISSRANRALTQRFSDSNKEKRTRYLSTQNLYFPLFLAPMSLFLGTSIYNLIKQDNKSIIPANIDNNSSSTTQNDKIKLLELENKTLIDRLDALEGQLKEKIKESNNTRRQDTIRSSSGRGSIQI